MRLTREPLGVVAVVTPFNFPAMISLWFLPFALVAGNTVVLKPSEADPTPGQLLVDLICEAELFDSGTVNLLHGDRAAVEGLLDHPGVDAVSFVGSARVARIVADRSWRSRSQVELAVVWLNHERLHEFLGNSSPVSSRTYTFDSGSN